MNFLLDTCTLLWFIGEYEKLSSNAISILEDGSNAVFLSYASIWEIAIKFSAGRLEIFQPSFSQFISQEVEGYDFQKLPIDIPHLQQVAELPFHHRDPFDRLIIAQSLVEDLPIITSDRAFDSYEIQRLW
ncbi:MAG: type II toxin-antitoxin system VapC family toxin [Chloroflexi bacterium]|nr:type II toxin-antitoxin system VapC family toxin [Chloroflexota bacterium]